MARGPRTAIPGVETRFQRLFEHSLDGVMLTHPDGRILAVNPAACAMLGRTGDEIRRLGRDGLVDPGDPRVGALLAERTRTGHARGVFAMVRADGERIEVDASSGTWLDERGETWTCLVLHDVTVERVALAALEASERRFRRIVESTSVGVWQADARQRTSYVNEAMTRMLGMTPAEVIGQPADRFLFAEDVPAHLEEVGTRQAGRPGRYERRLRRADGTPLWVQVDGTPLMDPDGCYVGTLAVCIDITGRMHAEEQARALTRRLLTVREDERRRLATALHHDVGSLAVGVMARLAGAEQDLAAGRLEAAAATLADVRRLFAGSIGDIKGLARELRPPDLDVAGLGATLRQMCATTGRETGLRVRFTDATRGHRVPTDAATALFRIAQEALVNTVRHARATRLRVRLDATPEGARLTVDDDGCGFDPARPPVDPPGLGLPSMRELARALDGRLDVASQPGRGTRVVAVVPVTGGNR